MFEYVHYNCSDPDNLKIKNEMNWNENKEHKSEFGLHVIIVQIYLENEIQLNKTITICKRLAYTIFTGYLEIVTLTVFDTHLVEIPVCRPN